MSVGQMFAVVVASSSLQCGHLFFLMKYHLALLASLFVQTVSEGVETIDLKA